MGRGAARGIAVQENGGPARNAGPPVRTRTELAEAFHDFVERFLARPHAFERQVPERLVDDVELCEEVVSIRLDVDETGGELTTPLDFVQPL